MAEIRNITPDTLSLFAADAPPIDPGDVVTVRDERFVDRAWPTSTWELVSPPALDVYVDRSTDEAYLFAAPDPESTEDPAPVIPDPSGAEPVDLDPTED